VAKVKSVRIALIGVVCALSACSTSSKEAVANLDTACQRVRDVNEQIKALDLDNKGEEIMKDPRVNDLLKQSSEATKDLANKVDAVAAADKGRLGQLRNTFEKNKELIGKIGSFVASESADEARDNARKFRKLADIIGAESCNNRAP
jgi:hypothetical protein